MVYSLTPDEPTPQLNTSEAVNCNTSENNSSRHNSLSGPQSKGSNQGSSSKLSSPMASNTPNDGSEDASWIELPMPGSEELEDISDNLESARKSLQMINSETQSGASLDHRSMEMEKHLSRLQEDNARLVSILEENNEAMKRNLHSVQQLRSELSSTRESYNELRESSRQQISHLQQENESLRSRISSMEEEARQKSLNEPIQYYPLDMNHEMKVQEMSSQLVEKDVKIQRLNDEVNSLRRQLDQTAEGINRMNLHDERRMSDVPPTPMMSNFSQASQFGTLNNNSNPDLVKEIQELKGMINMLREEKLSLEKLLSGDNNASFNGVTYNRTECAALHDDTRHGRRRHHHKHHRHHHKSENLRFPTGILMQGLSQASQAVTQSVRQFADQASTNLANRLNAINGSPNPI